MLDNTIVEAFSIESITLVAFNQPVVKWTVSFFAAASISLAMILAFASCGRESLWSGL